MPFTETRLERCLYFAWLVGDYWDSHMGMGQNPGTPGEHQNSW